MKTDKETAIFNFHQQATQITNKPHLIHQIVSVTGSSHYIKELNDYQKFNSVGIDTIAVGGI